MTLEEICSRFAALSDPFRLRMLILMHGEGELCVCELMYALDIPQPKASKHLAILRAAGLVRVRRDAQWVLYSITPEAGGWVGKVMEATVRELESNPEMAEVRRRLSTMGGRPALCRSE